MSLIRLLLSAGLALVVTLGLLTLMHYLIVNDFVEPEDGIDIVLPNIIMPKKEIETQVDDIDQDKPEEPDEPPPDLPEPDLDTPNASNTVQKSGLVTESLDMDIGFGGSGDLLLLVSPPPRYPSSAQSRGISGSCIVEFGVDTNGETFGGKIVSCTNNVFKNSSLKAIKKYKYKPRLEDGNPVTVDRVRQPIKFEMAD